MSVLFNILRKHHKKSLTENKTFNFKVFRKYLTDKENCYFLLSHKILLIYLQRTSLNMLAVYVLILLPK